MFQPRTISRTSRLRLPAGRAAARTAVGVAAAALLLAGCSSAPASAPQTDAASPTPTATAEASAAPEATATEAPADGSPQSEAEATAAATAAITDFYQTMSAVQATGGADLAPLSTVATCPTLDTVTSDTTWLADGGYTVSGAMTFSPSAVTVSARTADDGTVYPFGSVLATGCQDSTDYVVSQGGSAITLGVEPRTVFDLTVVFEPTAQAWLVENISENTASC
ncbi:hypothetical protein K2F54_15880 [Cryobacterium sp. 1639]|uniref:hypothetical protein n=1 Tax=Cryobacterium inferilacus TaxID=2866629 RepID=UPI001C73BEFA|nr:hypothetical protein [Cryobacterium sp. 1639]MBX0301453.1 hypothetical protein [Cryobacterium sp. 1639]